MKSDFLGVFLLIFLIIITFSMIRRRRSESRHYDEMQLKLRAAAYQTGFYVTALGSLLLIFLMDEDLVNLNRFADPSFSVFVVLMTGIITFAVTCIAKEAFFPVGGGGNTYLFLYTVIVVLNGILSIRRIADGSIFENGRITFRTGSGLVCAMSFLAVLIAILIKKAQAEDEVAE